MSLADISGLVSGITAAAVSMGDGWWSWFSQVFWPAVWQETQVLVSAPASTPEMLWITIPLAVTLLLMTFYFGMYRKEEMGWNTAVGNSIVLMFVAIDLLRLIYTLTDPPAVLNYAAHFWQTLVVLIILLEAILMIFFNFFHILPKRLAYFFSAPLPVNLQAYIVAAIVYTGRDPTWSTFWAGVLMFLALFICMHLLQWSERKMLEHMHETEVDEAKALQQEAEMLEEKAKGAEPHEAEELLQTAQNKKAESKKLVAEAVAAEQVEFGEVRPRIKAKAQVVEREKPVRAAKKPAKRKR